MSTDARILQFDISRRPESTFSGHGESSMVKLHYFQELKEWTLKAQWQIWDFLQGANSLGVNFKRKILAWYDKLFASYNTYFVKRGRVPLFSLNELGEKSVNLTILGKFVNKP